MSTVKTPKLNYESFLPKSRGVAYVCPNEDLGIWRELVKGKRIQRAAGICSGGEVGFFALLPTVREELVLIDHNHGSLYFAVVKYLLLREWGYAGVVRLFKHPDQLRLAIQEVEKDIPEALRNARDDLSYSHVRERLVKAAQKSDMYSASRGTLLTEQWERPNRYQRKVASSKLDKVKFVHGDFDALDNQGKFDLLYMSNAHESGNGNDKRKDLERIGKCLNPGGFVLSSLTICKNENSPTRQEWDYHTRIYVTRPNPHYQTLPENWKLVQSVPRRDVGMSRWSYNLYQVQPVTAEREAHGV